MDEIGYRAVIIGFPLLTLTVVLGAVWAEIAWGSYWSWDPKGTATLLTWLVYGAACSPGSLGLGRTHPARMTARPTVEPAAGPLDSGAPERRALAPVCGRF